MLDIVPTETIYATLDQQRATAVWRYFFLVLWSAHGIGASYDVLAIWREQAPTAHGRALECGHFLAEERPEETTAELVSFLEER